jgi:hypothetical protein
LSLGCVRIAKQKMHNWSPDADTPSSAFAVSRKTRAAEKPIVTGTTNLARSSWKTNCILVFGFDQNQLIKITLFQYAINFIAI